MLRSKMMLVLVDQVGRREMAKGLRVGLVDHIHPSFAANYGHYYLDVPLLVRRELGKANAQQRQ